MLPFRIGSAITHGTSYGCSASALAVIAGTSDTLVCRATLASPSSCTAPSQR